MNKKIFIMAYSRKNLGDDIFIKMILEKYPNFQFYMKIPDEIFLEWLTMKYKNLHVLKGEDTDEELYKSNVEDYDAYIYVGGSIFMEGGKVYNLSPKFYDFVKRCKNRVSHLRDELHPCYRHAHRRGKRAVLPPFGQQGRQGGRGDWLRV